MCLSFLTLLELWYSYPYPCPKKFHKPPAVPIYYAEMFYKLSWAWAWAWVRMSQPITCCMVVRMRRMPARVMAAPGSIRLAFRAYPLIEIRQTAPCRAIRRKSSDSRQQYLSQQYPPPLLSEDHPKASSAVGAVGGGNGRKKILQS